MTWKRHSELAEAGDLAQLVGLSHKHFIIRLEPGAIFQSHRGIIPHDTLIGLPWGSQVYSHNGSPFFLLQPALADLLRSTRRVTQILYPKDIGYILVHMGIGPGMTVFEAGTGSGALTTAFAYSVGPEGHVTTYEAKPETQRLAKQNLRRLGLDDRVTFREGSIAEGVSETGQDALFLDLPNPYDFIPLAKQVLRPGGTFGSILPTVNQVSRLLVALHLNDFAFVDVVEVLLRHYKPDPERLRPVDRMVAHTGFLIFARSVLPSPDERGAELLKEVEAGLGGDEDGRD